MSLIKANAVQIGQSPTATQNFTLAVPSSPDGTIKLARGNAGATTQDVMNVSNAGVVSFPQGLGNISNSTAIATGSTTARSLANRFADVVNVKDFGAVGDGVADDTAAIQAAVNSNKPIHFSKGIYLCSNKITKTGGNFVISGDAANVSEIRFTGSSAINSGFYFSPQISEDYTCVSGLTISTSTQYILGKNALHIDGTAQVVPGTPPLTQNRSTRRILINDLIISGINNSATTGWSAGIKITSLGWFNISNYLYIGDYSQGAGTGNWKGQAIWIQGQGLPVESKISKFSIYSAEFAILMPDYFEGLYVAEFDIVNVQYGIYGEYNASWSSIPSVDCGFLQPTVSRGHINCRKWAILAKNVNQSSISELNIYINPENGDSNFGGILLNNGTGNTITFNNISKMNSAVTTLSWGVLFIDVSKSNITGNSIYFLDDSGIYINGTLSDSNYIVNNIFYDTTTGVFGDAGSQYNYLLLNQGILLSGNLYSVNSSNYIQNRQYSISSMVNIVGGSATEIITISIPAGYFSNKPNTAYLMGVDSNQIIGWYNYSTSSSSFAQFSIANRNGSNLSSGSYRFSVSMFE